MEGQKSLNEQAVRDHREPWTDGHITLEFVSFDPRIGEATFDVHEHHQNVGFYYIEVHFTSGNSTRFPHDGTAPNRSNQLRAHTARPNDEVRGIKVVRVRD
jgi:hypothetical protein